MLSLEKHEKLTCIKQQILPGHKNYHNFLEWHYKLSLYRHHFLLGFLCCCFLDIFVEFLLFAIRPCSSLSILISRLSPSNVCVCVCVCVCECWSLLTFSTLSHLKHFNLIEAGTPQCLPHIVAACGLPSVQLVARIFPFFTPYNIFNSKCSFNLLSR